MKIFSWMALGCATLFWTSAQATDWQVNGDIYLPMGQGVPVVYPVYGNEDKPLALSQLTIGNGQTFRNDPLAEEHNPVAVAYFSLPEELQEYLQRLGIVDRDGDLLSFTRDVTITCALHHPTTSGDSWRYKGMPEGNAAVRFFPFSGEPIGFAIPADMTRNALRTASLPNGFVLRRFPYELEDQAWWAMRERSDDRFSAFASLLMLSDGAVYVSTEVLPPAGFQIRDGGDIDCFLMPSEKGQIDAGLERLNHQFDQDLADYMLRQFSHNAPVAQVVADAYLKNVPWRGDHRNPIDTKYGSHRYTALHLAALADRADVIRTLFPIKLLEMRLRDKRNRDSIWALLNAQDTSGKTAMDLAFEMGHDGVLYHLLIRMFSCIAEEIRAKMATLAVEMEKKAKKVVLAMEERARISRVPLAEGPVATLVREMEARRAALAEGMEAILAEEMAARRAVLAEGMEATLVREMEARRAALAEEMKAAREALTNRYWHDYTVFHLAAVYGEKYANDFLAETALPILPDTALLSARTQEGDTAFRLAIQCGHSDSVELLFKVFKSQPDELEELLRLPQYDGKTALHWAIERYLTGVPNNLAVVKALAKVLALDISLKAKKYIRPTVNPETREVVKRNRPINFAGFGWIENEIVSFLGHRIYERYHEEMVQAIWKTLEGGDESILGEVLSEAVTHIPEVKLCEAAAAGQLKEVKRLLNAGVDIESRFAVGVAGSYVYTDREIPWPIYLFGVTPLHLAVVHNHPDVVRELLAKGASVESCAEKTVFVAIIDEQMTALHLAALCRSVDAAKVLIDYYPELLTIKNKRGCIPLYFAVLYAHASPSEGMIKVLLDQISGSKAGMNRYVQEQVNVMSQMKGYSALERAIKDCHPEIVEYILQKMIPEQIQALGDKRCTLLHRVVAAMCGIGYTREGKQRSNIIIADEAVSRLVKIFFDHPDLRNMWSVRDADGCMPIYEAVKDGFFLGIILQEMLNREMPLELDDARALWFKIADSRGTLAEGDASAMRMLSQVPGFDVNAQDELGDAALHKAVGLFCWRRVMKLLDIPGIDVSIQNKKGQTPLHIMFTAMPSPSAAEFMQCVQKFLSNPAVNIDLQDDEGMTALSQLMRVERTGTQGILEMLLSKRLPRCNQAMIGGLLQLHQQGTITDGSPQELATVGTALHWAIRNNGPFDVLQTFCMEYRGYKDEHFFATQDGAGRTALHWAVEMGDIDAVLLILGGMTPAQLAIQDGSGKTAKNLAEEKEHTDIVRILNEFANVAGDHHGHLLRMSAGYGRMAPLQWFLAMLNSFSFLNSKDSASGRTALHWAASGGHEEIVARLLRVSRIDVNIQDNRGLTALHVAVENEQIDCVRALLDAEGIDVNIQDNQNLTPRALAQALGDDEIVAAITDHIAAAAE